MRTKLYIRVAKTKNFPHFKVDGLSTRLDRAEWREQIKALGNAVVPQCAEFFAERIKEVVLR